MNECLVILVRAVISFFTLLIFTRILGKQQLSQLTFFDYVLGITIGSIAGGLTTDLSNAPLPYWIGLLAWTILSFLMEYICLKSRKLRYFLVGDSQIIILNGKILEKNLKTIRYTISDILELLRNNGVFNLDEISMAILESNGKISILKKSEFEPLTSRDIGIKKIQAAVPHIVIYDGIIVYDNLKELNKDSNWLLDKLKENNINSFSSVFLATLTENDDLYIDKYDDYIKADNYI